MGANVAIKVVGFDDAERHSLNTLMRLSERGVATYALWSPESPSPPQVVLVDMDSYEATLELASPNFNPNTKLICVGAKAPEQAWRSLQRPVDWTALVRELDGLFTLRPELDIDIGLDAAAPDNAVPPGIKQSVLVGMTRDERLYLRARLALAGLTTVDEAPSAGEAIPLISQRNYDLAIISNELDDADAWSLIQALKDLPSPVRSIVLATHFPSWAVMEQADKAGCSGILEIPFNPRQIYELLLKV